MTGSGRVVLAGGSGFIGRALAEHLRAKGFETVVLTRSPRARGELRWDGCSLGEWARSIEGARALVNLTGRSVDTRHTARNRLDIVQSRVRSVDVLGQAVAECRRPPEVWLQSSSLAIYGDPGDRVIDEDAPAGTGFSPQVCVAWERALAGVEVPQTRRVALRIGLALARGGGALARLEALTRLGLGGTVGSGRQWVSWLHLDDLLRVFAWGLEGDVEGALNVTAPEPVTNAALMRELRRAVGRPWSPPAPAPAVRLGCLLMRTDPGLALGGRRCVPRRLEEQGFSFEHSRLRPALEELF